MDRTAWSVYARRVKVVVILVCCALAIVGLTYRGVGAWLRDRQRNAEKRRAPGGGENSH